jgi:hypothetical protein
MISRTKRRARLPGTTSDGVTGGLRKLHVGEHYKFRLIKRRRNVGEIRNTYCILFGKPERMYAFRRPRCIWEDNIKIDINIM